MKSLRQIAILEIIQNQSIETQEELASALQNHGFSVTQATVSRDIKELRLVKVMKPDGTYRYAAQERENEENGLSERFARMLAESLLSAAASRNLVVVKTLAGSASMAAEALDSLQWPEVLGSLAGDNTILLIIREDVDAGVVVRRVQELMK